MDSRLLAVSSFLLLGFFAAVSNAGGTPKGEAVLRRNPMQRMYKEGMMTPAEHAFLKLKRSEMGKRTGEMPPPYDKRRQGASYRNGFDEVEDVVIVPETQAQVTSPFGAQNFPPLDFGSFGFEGSGDKFDEGFEFSGDFEEVSEGSGDSDELFEGSGEVEEMFEGSGDEDEEEKVGETLAEKLEALVGKNEHLGSGEAKKVSEGSGDEALGSGEAEEEEAPAITKNPTAAQEFGALMGKNEALRDFVVELKKIAEDFEAKKEAIEEDMKVLTMILNGQKAVNNLWTKKIDGLKAEIEELDIELEDCDSKLDDLETRKRK